MSDNFVFFWGGPFSQWYKSEFTIDGKTYNCAEQYMMAMKALVFNDDFTRARIMASKDLKEQKALGRQVRNFDADKWSKVARAFVYRANFDKFSDSKLKQILLSTGEKELVEASPHDTIWGIGLGPDDPKRFDKSNWRGTNWLGQVLMEVRRDLK